MRISYALKDKTPHFLWIASVSAVLRSRPLCHPHDPIVMPTWKALLLLALFCVSVIGSVVGCAKEDPSQNLGSGVQIGHVTQALCTSTQLATSSATASSIENSGSPASEAIDGITGDSTNRWSSLGSGTTVAQWLYVDLGATRYIDKVEIDFVTTNAWSKDFTLSVAPAGTTDFSVDSAAWSTIYTRTGVPSTDSRNHVITTSSTPALTASTGRYLRFKSTLHNLTNVSFYEMRVFGSTDAACATTCSPSCGACSTCTSGVCVPLANGTVCRTAVAGGCDVQESCDGTATDCPADVIRPSGAVCRAAVAGGCDIAETCNGSTTACPTDVYAATGTACTDDADSCTQDVCSGTSGTCPRTLAPACTPCGNSALSLPAAVASTVNGANTAANARDSDAATRWESVHGAGADPSWVYVDLGANKHVSSVSLDWEGASAKNYTIQVAPDGTCAGTGTGCLSTNAPWTTLFTSSTYTTNPNHRIDDITVSGVGRYVRMYGTSRMTIYGYSLWEFSVNGDSNAVCGTSCSPSCGACATCSNSVCLTSASGTSCRAAAGDCDLAETCNGSAQTCPTDVFKSSGTACGSSTDTNCDNPDTCNSSGTCQNNYETTSVQCRAAVDVCDVAENCNGSGTCPTDLQQTSGFECRAAAAGGCDVAETCNGSVSTCPADAVAATGTVCRASAGTHDVVETCDGSANSCPANVVLGVLSVDGTYGASCVNRTGAWSVGLEGAFLQNPALSVVMGNDDCALTLTQLRAGSGEGDVYVADTPFVLTGAYNSTAASFSFDGVGPVIFYGNSKLDSTTFQNDFAVSFLSSDASNLVSAGRAASYQVVSSPFVEGALVSPDYTIDMTGLSIQVDANQVVQTVGATAQLLDGIVTGQDYVVESGALGATPSYAQIDAAYTAGSKVAISTADPTIAASAFSLTGSDLTGNQVRNVIIANEAGGLSSYQVFRVTFNPAGI